MTATCPGWWLLVGGRIVRNNSGKQVLDTNTKALVASDDCLPDALRNGEHAADLQPRIMESHTARSLSSLTGCCMKLHTSVRNSASNRNASAPAPPQGLLSSHPLQVLGKIHRRYSRTDHLTCPV